MAEELSLSSKIEQVRLQPCFQNFYDAEIEELAGLFSLQEFSAGETIVEEGDPVDCVYLIVEGDTDVYKSILDENRKFHDEHVAVLGPGKAIGLSATGFYSLSGMRTATCIAKTDMVCLKLSVARFRGFTLAHSHAHEVMTKQAEAAEQQD